MRSCRGCPGCPPRFLPLDLQGGFGLTCGRSDEGGLEEFEEFWPSRASSWAIRSSNPVTTAAMAGRRFVGMASHRSAGMDGGRLMPEDGQYRRSESRRTRRGVNGYHLALNEQRQEKREVERTRVVDDDA